MRKKDHSYGNNLNPYLKKINSLLTELNITPSYLSKTAGLGTSTLSNLLKRNNVPTVASMDRICAVLGTRVSTFIKDVEDDYPELFISMQPQSFKIDPLYNRKNRIVDEWAALPVSDRHETLKRMSEAYGSIRALQAEVAAVAEETAETSAVKEKDETSAAGTTASASEVSEAAGTTAADGAAAVKNSDNKNSNKKSK